MFQDATIEAEKRACGRSAHAWSSRKFACSPAVSHISFPMTAQSPAQRARLARPCVGHSALAVNVGHFRHGCLPTAPEGSALALQFVHLRHGCLPTAPEGFRCAARQNCAAAPSALPAQPQLRTRAGDSTCIL